MAVTDNQNALHFLLLIIQLLTDHINIQAFHFLNLFCFFFPAAFIQPVVSAHTPPPHTPLLRFLNSRPDTYTVGTIDDTLLFILLLRYINIYSLCRSVFSFFSFSSSLFITFSRLIWLRRIKASREKQPFELMILLTPNLFTLPMLACCDL